MKRICLLVAVLFMVLRVSGHPYWDSLDVYRLNKVQPHSLVIPEGEQWSRCLDGRWAFRYVDNPSQLNVEWLAAETSLQGWDSIRVPGNIELQGYGVPVYVNMQNEFPSNPPHVPHDYNPVGIYALDFDLPTAWQSRRTIVKFGAAGGGLFLYVNGREVGYSEDSKTPAEWDITRYLHQGTNRLVAQVVRWSNGSYLECQDMWRMSGITRSVVLYSVPTTYITDYRVSADLDTTDYRTGRLDVMLDFNRVVGEGWSAEIEVEGLTKQRKRLDATDWYVGFQPEVGLVQPWTDTTPRLYPLAMRLFNPQGQMVEEVRSHIGFRHIEVKNALLCLNGNPMQIRGVNRHEHSSAGGHYVSAYEMRRDISLMKRLGINAVRTSHYPNDELWYYLCDSAGIYLWDEANVESHAQGYGPASLAKQKEWLNPILDRIYSMYRRDRNHPSVVAWSLGNECGNGYCMEEAYRFLKGKDNTRPVTYERAEQDWNTDVVEVMYPSVHDLSAYARNPRNRRPYIIAEYCHAMGNSMGGLQDYWDTIARYPILQGGFVWDWMDQAFGTAPYWKAGGDLGTLPHVSHDDNFCANGLLAADATLHPHAYELQAVYTALRDGRTPQLQPFPTTPTAAFKASSMVRTSVRHSQAIIVGRDFEVRLSTADGSITSYRYHGHELLAAPLRYNFFRPPTDNDLRDPLGGRAWQGLEALQPQVISVNKVEAGLLMQLRLSTPDGAVLRLDWQVQADRDGRLLITSRLVPSGQFRTLPKLGIQFGLDTTFLRCKFSGNIFETYPDRQVAYRYGTWQQSLHALSAPQYVMPQEQGNHRAQWALFEADGYQLGISGESLNFSIRRWSDTALASAHRWHELTPDPYYTVSADYRVAPLGTASCGPGVEPRYTISGDSNYLYSFTLDPTVCATPLCYATPDLNSEPTPIASAVGSPIATVASSTPPTEPYTSGYPALLHDGRRGVVGDYRHGWTGFQGNDTVVLSLTLRHYATLAQIRVGVAHCPTDWVSAPTQVEASWSIDGKRWSEWTPLAPLNPPANLTADCRRVAYSLQPRKARAITYIRLRFVANPVLPDWHPYASQPAWLMVDEIEINTK